MTSTSIFPNASIACSTSAKAWLRSVTSALIATASPPAAWHSATHNFAASSLFKKLTVTEAPSAAKAREISAPIPRLAPVTTTDLPVKFVLSALVLFRNEIGFNNLSHIQVSVYEA